MASRGRETDQRMSGLLRAAAFTMLAIALPLSSSAITTSTAKTLPTPGVAMTSALWVADFHQLLDELAARDGNFDWELTTRHIEFSALKDRTEALLNASDSDDDAHAAIASFLQALGDDGLAVSWTSSAGTPSPSARPLCARLSYTRVNADGVDFASSAGYTALRDDDASVFPAGVLRLSSTLSVGVIRIPQLGPYAYPDLCERARTDAHLGPYASCDSTCAQHLEDAVDALLSRALERRIRDVQTAGARAIVVDVTASRGGTSWAEAAARTLTPRHLKSPQLAIVSDAHWVSWIDERRAQIRTDLRTGDPAPQTALVDADIALDQSRALAAQTCDRRGLLATPPQSPSCSALVPSPLYASGAFAYARAGSYASLVSKATLFVPSRYVFTDGVNRLPLYVLVDGETSGRATYFAALLHDNDAAKLIGTPSGGAACTTGGGVTAT